MKKLSVGKVQMPAPTLKGVYRALEILEYIATSPGRASDIAIGLKLPWTTLHRTLTQLEQAGFLNKEIESGRYYVGEKMWLIGTSYLANHRVLEVAQPYLDNAAEKGNFTVQLVQRSGRLAITLYSRHVSGEVITKATYGFHFPLHCGSKGQILLAYSPKPFLENYLSTPLEKLTEETIIEPEVLRDKINDIQQQGFAFTEGDVQPFTGSISAPILGRNGTIIAAVCIIARRTTFGNKLHMEEITETALQTSQSISMALGWRPGTK